MSDITEPEICDSPFKKLSKKTRIIAFACTFGGGLLLCILCSIFQDNLVAFICVYLVGVFVIFFSPIWFVGPKKQFKQMADKKRWPALVGFLALTIIGAVLAGTCPDLDWLPWIFYVLSWPCVFWYVISYIPFLQAMITGCLKSCFKCCKCVCC